MRRFKRGCAAFLASTMILGLLPGMSARAAEEPKAAAKEAAAASDFDAYREPFLSGPVQTWAYQGEEFDYENSRNQIFADDQEDGDLTKSIIQKGSVDTSKLGDQTVTYEVTDSDGNKSALETTVTVLPKGSTDADKKNMKRTLYTLPDASHLTDIGFNRGYYHDRQNLGFWLPANEALTVRLVNHEEFSGELKLKLLNDDAWSEKLVTMTDGAEDEFTERDNVIIPANGDWITVKNKCYGWTTAPDPNKPNSTIHVKTDELKYVDSVPFIYTPKDTPVQPVIEIKWNDAFQAIPYYRYGDDEESFFNDWEAKQAPYAIVEGQAATFLIPLKDKDLIIDNPDAMGRNSVYAFHSIDDMLEWYAGFVTQYDAYGGLDFYTDDPVCQNVRAKFFIKANQNGVGLAYYGSDHSANNADNLGGYLYKDWVSLHEFGHGYEGAIANQEHSFGESTNNIMGFYYEKTYRPETDFGWLLDGATGDHAAWLAKYKWLGEESEAARNLASDFDEPGADGQPVIGHRLRLFMWTNALDALGSQKTTAAMHTQYRRYYYENRKHPSSSNVVVDSFSRAGGYNMAPYFDGWHIVPTDEVKEKIYDDDLPMLYYIRNLIPDDAAAETARQELSEKRVAAGEEALNGIYSLASTDDIAGLSTTYTSHVKLSVSIDDLSTIAGKKILIKNGEKIAASVPVQENQEDYEVDLPAGIYEVELPIPREAGYQYDKEYLVAAADIGNSGTKVEKELAYTKINGDPLVEDVALWLGGYGWHVVDFDLKTGENKLNCRINKGTPHSGLPGRPRYIQITIQSPDGTELLNRTLPSTVANVPLDEDYDFPIGSKLIIHHDESKIHFASRYTKEDHTSVYKDGTEDYTLVRTEYGLVPEDWAEERKKDSYFSLLCSYSKYLMENVMTESDIANEGKLNNLKQPVKIAYAKLDEERKEEFDRLYGILLGHANEEYKYGKIHPSLLTGTADSWEPDEEPEYALDESDKNAWHTSYNGNCISNHQNTYTITLAEPRNVGRLEYVAKNGENGRILTYKLEYSETEAGDDFQDVQAESLPEWANDDSKKSVDFDAPNARRIRITGLSTAGTKDGSGNGRFMSAKHFWLYEKYEDKPSASYLSDMELGMGSNAVADRENKTVTLTGGQDITADLTGKEFDTFTATVSLAQAAAGASFKVYNGEGDGSKLLYQFERTSWDEKETFAVGVSGVRKLRFEVSSGAQAVLDKAKFGNQDHKKDIFLVKGDQAALSANTSLTDSSEGRTRWSSENAAVAVTDEYGNITAAGTGDTTVREMAYGATEPLIGNVSVKNSLEEVIQAIESVKSDKKAELEAYTDANDYSQEGKQERTAALEEGRAAIDAAMNLSGISAALDAAKKKLDAISTSTEDLAEELKQKKAEAKQALEDYKNPEEYRKMQRQELKRAIAEGWLAIDEQDSVAGIEAALDAAKAKLDQIQTDMQITRAELEQTVSGVRKRMESLEESDYEPAAWKRLEDKLAAAQEVLDKEEATIPEMATARKELAAAENALLKPQALKDAEKELQELIDAYKTDLVEADYQTESWKAFQQVLKEAETYLPGGTNEQFEDEEPVLEAKEALIAAKDAMEPTMLVLEGDWEKGLRASNSGLAVEEGKLHLSGAGGNADPATFVSTETFDFSKDGSFEFDVENADNNGRFGLYLDYSEEGGKAYGLCLFFETGDDGNWMWQTYIPNNGGAYKSSDVKGSKSGQKQHVKATWTAEGKCNMYVDGKKVFAQDFDGAKDENNEIKKSPEGKIALMRHAGETIVSNFRPLKRQMILTPSDTEAATAKIPVKLNAKYRSVADRKTKARWSSSNEDAAYADRAGNVYFVGTGEAQITATAVLADGTTHSAEASVDLPAQISGSKAGNVSGEASGIIKGAWSNTQASDGSDGPASYAVDGDLDKKWHSWYSGGNHFTPTDEDPAKLAIEFTYDLSAGAQIKFLQTSSENGQVEKYQVVTGNKYNEMTHEIEDDAVSGIARTEAEIVENPVEDSEKWVTLQLPQTEDAGGRLGRYLQIRVMRGRNNFACIKEISAEFDKDFETDEAEQGYLAANREYVAAIKDLEGEVAKAEAADRKNYKENDWNALQQALADATQALESGAGKERLNELKTALEEAYSNTTIQYSVTYNWNYEDAGKDVRYVEQSAHAVPLTRENAPKRKGYYFTEKWYLEPECENEFAFSSTAITEDKELFAQWMQSADKTALKAAIADAKAELDGPYTEESIEILRNQIRDAQQVADDETATQDAVDQATADLRKAIEDLEPAGQTPDDPHTVTFNWNWEQGGTVQQSVQDGACAVPPEQAPKRNGWTFTGKWYLEPECETEFACSEMPITGDCVLYAEWKKDEEQDPDPDLTQAKQELEAVLAQISGLSQADYSQEGWSALQDAVSEARNALEAGNAEAVAEARKKLEAAIAYTKTEETEQKKEQLNNLYDACAEYDEADYTPESWETFQKALQEARKVLDKGASATLEEIRSANELLERAVAGLRAPGGTAEEHDVTYHWNFEQGGTETERVADGGYATAPKDAPKRDGYSFTGKWYLEAECREEYEFDKTPVTGDLSLYAEWKKEGTANPGGDDKDTAEQKKKEAAKQVVAAAKKKADAVVKAGRGDYTATSWNAFLSAYNAVKSLTEAQKNRMTADKLKTLADNLTKAQAALQKEVKKEKISSLKFASKTYQIANGKSVNLKKELTILPASAANQKLVWKISNAKFAKLNSGTGVVKALKKGVKKTVTVTVTTEDGKVSAKATVKVMKGRVSKIAAKGAKKVKAKAGKSVTLKTSVKTTGGKPVNKALKWTSSNTKVATVKGVGKLAASAKVKIAKGAKKGKKATITAVSTDGTNKKLKFTVTVK